MPKNIKQKVGEIGDLISTFTEICQKWGFKSQPYKQMCYTLQNVKQ